LFIFSDSNPSTDASKGVRYRGKKARALGIEDYFNMKMKYADWKLPNGKTARIRLYPKSYETIIKYIVKNGFEIIDYVDCKPLKSARRKFPDEYRLWSKVPKFVIWKLRKK